MDGRMDEWTDGMDGWKDEWTDEIDGWMDGWMDGLIEEEWKISSRRILSTGNDGWADEKLDY